ncbi:cucumisin-like [Abrus precatorius]|uniref:Cucumisin-like n=1 Tax=Abrus precatorius TaxID=3816 RepID=A0A8B8JEC8_ABRPR|nr:cucumisin-like [Abrus precatorius]
MISLGLCHFFQIFTCILLMTPSFSEDDSKTYIVYMGEHPKGVESIELLHTSMVQNVLGSKFAPNALLHSYKSFNGFVARLTNEETKRMRGMDGVVSVIPNRNHRLETSKSWDFIGFPEQVKRTNVESNTIVGVIDSGIWPDSDSFSGGGFGPPPQKWKGSCRNFTCNNKIVGAKYFRINGMFGKGDIISPKDTSGHGTHCASIAAGNLVKSASFFGLGLGTARGGVPLARIAAYKVCWSVGCREADILAAFDEAIMDGVDILSVSMGPSKVRYNNYFEDIYAIGAFHALKKGILMSKTAGNLGSKPFTISNNAPWFISVAANTIDRKFLTSVQLGNGKIYQGVSVNTFDLKNTSYPLIYAGDAPNINGGFNSSTSRSCPEDSLDMALVKGKIVLCDGYRGPKSLGLASGAAGIIFRSSSSKAVAHIFALPATHLSQNDGTLVYSYIKSMSNPTATIFKSTEGKDSLAPYIAPFSSRGPNKITPNILKPDIAAPGVNILAAWPPYAAVSGVQGDTRSTKYKLLSGTSMACPHVTGAAAYVKSFHPNWTPAMIKSALMTTATSMSPTTNAEAEFAYGAGQINPVKAVNPGLVYDASEIDYVKFLCGEGYDTRKLQIITGDNSTCTKANNGTVWDLNLPSFALSTIRSTKTSAIFRRTVTNVGSATSTYNATITTHPSSLIITVLPNVLHFSSLGQKQSFTLKIEGSITADNVSSSLIWDDGTYQVKSPIVVYVPP